MNIDERLDRLTARHEALTQTVELMTLEGRERGERIDREFERVGKELDRVGKELDRVGTGLDKLGNLVSGLVSVAEAHGRRLDKLESE